MSKLEAETYTGKSIQAWKDQAAKAGLVLKAGEDGTSGDFLPGFIIHSSVFIQFYTPLMPI